MASIDPSIHALMAKINKKQGPGSILLGSEILHLAHPTITTGSLSLDVALGGGWAVNHFIEVIGHNSAGKTLVMLKTIAANQKRDPNWLTVWFASEDFHEPYAEMLGVDLSRVIVMSENVMETVFNAIIQFLETRAVDCIVVDSLPALLPAKEDEDDMEDYQVGLGARLIGKFFRKAQPYIMRSLVVEERAVTVFFINQWRNKIGAYGDPNTAPGGMAKDFYCFQRVEIRRDEFIKNTKDDPIGQRLKLVNKKNKFAPPGRVGLVDAYFRTSGGHKAGEYDLGKDAIAAGEAHGVIGRSSGTSGSFIFGDKTWRSRGAMADEILADRKLQRELRKAVLEATTNAEDTSGRTEESVERPREASRKTNGSGTPQRKRVGQPAAGHAHRSGTDRVQNSTQGKSSDNTQARRPKATPVQRSRRGA